MKQCLIGFIVVFFCTLAGAQNRQSLINIHPSLSYAPIFSSNLDKANPYLVPNIQVQYYFSDKIAGYIGYSYFTQFLPTTLILVNREFQSDFHYLSLGGNFMFKNKWYGTAKAGIVFPENDNYTTVFGWSLGTGYYIGKRIDVALIFNSFNTQNYITSITNEKYRNALNTLELRLGYNFTLRKHH